MKIPGSILVVGNFLSATLGSRGVCEDFAQRLASAGWVTVTTSNKPGRVMRLLDMLWTVWSRRSQYELATIDTFSGPAFFWAELVGFALRGLGKPFILILHGGNLPGFSRQHPQRIRRLFSLAAAVTTPSRYLQEQMRPYRADLILLPNPIDLSKYKFIGRREAKPTLVWLRAFHAIYNAPLAIRTLGMLASDYSHIQLLMGGGDRGDESFQKAKQLAEELGLSDSVEFAGKIPNSDVPNWLQKGDIFINTTSVDNTPISVLEAMACGLCVVSTNVGGIPHLLKDGDDALLSPHDDPQRMATAIRRILDEPELAERLSKNARRKAEEFDWPMVLPQWEALFSQVVERKGESPI